MSASSTNARQGSMPPPSKCPPRETLVERAGKPGRQPAAHPNPRPMTSGVNATSLTGPRSTSYSSSTSSSRPPSSASGRNVSNSSFSSSVGPASRLPSAQSIRSQSLNGHSRLQKPSYGNRRAASSLEVYDEEPNTAQVLGKRKGRTPSSSTLESSPETLHPSKLRSNGDPGSMHVSPTRMRKHRSAMTLRECSIATAMGGLNLNGTSSHPTPILEEAVPVTPSQIPKLANHASHSALSSPTRSPKKKTPKALPLYLNKSTNDTTIAWDHDQRLLEVEHMQKKMLSDIKGATSETESMKEIVNVYKERSKL